MEYSVIEGKKLNSKNYESEGFRYVKARECEGSIYIKCALFRTNSCPCIGRIDKATNLMNLTHIHNQNSRSSNYFNITSPYRFTIDKVFVCEVLTRCRLF